MICLEHKIVQMTIKSNQIWQLCIVQFNCCYKVYGYFNYHSAEMTVSGLVLIHNIIDCTVYIEIRKNPLTYMW